MAYRQLLPPRRRSLRIAARRGKNIAGVALARGLAAILFAMLHDGATYRPRGARGRAGAATIPVAPA